MAAGLGRPAGEHPTAEPATAAPAAAALTAGVGPAGVPGAPAPEGRSILGRRLFILAVAGAVLAVDQVTKTWALRHAQDPVHVIWTLRLAVTFNSGTAFGLGQGSTAVIIGGVVVLVVVLLGLGRRASRNATWPGVVAMGLLLGGAMGNLADRLVRHHQGAVIDFIDLRWWPVFNIADASITVGAVLLTLVLFRAREGAPEGEPAAHMTPNKQ